MSNTALATADPVIVADELIDGKYDVQPTAAIRASHTNRKRFNAEALQQLAASIRTHGVIQPILIRPVTPNEDEPEAYEIVAGERRWRASVIAGMATIPVLIRRLSDLQAAEIQILENLQREDPHPIEEAEGYQQLMFRHGYNANQLADKVKKSPSYIYGRLKLCALTPSVREKFFDDELPASTALLIARIPVPALQIRALGEILKPFHWSTEPMSYRTAAEYIQKRYTLDLGHAVFSITDAKLVAKAGACAKCPKRTGNEPEIFKDMSADICTDPDCFAEKGAAHNAGIIAIASKNGIPVYEGEEAEDKLSEAESGQNILNNPLVTQGTQLWHFLRVSPATGMSGSVRTNLSVDQLPAPAAYALNENGAITPMYDRAAVQSALEAAGKCESADERAKKNAGELTDGQQKADTKQKAAAEAAAALEAESEDQTKLRVALYSRMRRRDGDGPSLELLRAATKFALNTSMPLPHKLIDDLYPFDASNGSEIAAYIDNASFPDVAQILIDAAIGEILTVDSWSLRQNREEVDAELAIMTDLAKHTGIDVEKVRRSLIPEAPPELPSDAALDYATLPDLVDFINTDPDRIDELTKAVMTHPRGELTGMLERAANTLGYTYSEKRWHKGAAPSPAADPDPDDGADLAEQLDEVVRAPATKAGKPANKSKRRK